MPDSIIVQCRERFGRPPRNHGFFERFHLTAWPPFWLQIHKNDPLWGFYRQQKQTRVHGEIVWGHVVQANTLLFQPGRQDCPAEVVYSFQEIKGGNIGYLNRVAATMFQLKGTAQDDDDLADIAEHLADERERRPEHRVPRRLTPGQEVFLNGLMVVRKHLPDGYLKRNFFPLIVNRSTSFPMILSWRYWPQRLVDAWRANV